MEKYVQSDNNPEIFENYVFVFVLYIFYHFCNFRRKESSNVISSMFSFYLKNFKTNILKFLCLYFVQAGFDNGTIHQYENDNNDDFIAEVFTISSEYLHCDDDLICFGTLTEEETLETVNSENLEASASDPLDSEVFEIENISPSNAEILKSSNILRTFCSENEIECNFIFEKIEDKVLKHSIKLNQSKMTDFLK